MEGSTTNLELERAWQLHRLGRDAEAEIATRRVLSQHPAHEWALRLLSSTLTSQERHDEAVERAQQACREYPDTLRCWIRLSAAHLHRFDPPAAIEAAQIAVRCAPTSPVAHHTLARANLCQTQADQPRTAHDPAAGLLAAEEAVRLAPESAEYRVTRAWALVRLGRNREARAEYHRVLALNPSDALGINGLGIVCQRAWPIVAARHYAAALAVNPQSRTLRNNLYGAIAWWTYQMIWIWLWGGLALGMLRMFAAQAFVLAGLGALAAATIAGTATLLRRVPRGSWGVMSRAATQSLVPTVIRVSGSVVAACVVAFAPPACSAVALAFLGAFLVLEWKVDFTDMDRRVLAWVRQRVLRAPADHGRLP